MNRPGVFYLHGFASGPSSSKGMAFAEHLGKLGLLVERLNLRVPSFERLRLSAMIEHTRKAITARGSEQAVVIGSSLGGICAARVAECDRRVMAAVLLAPAFRLAAEWQAKADPAEWAAWEKTGWVDQEDYAEGGMRKVDFGFIQDAAKVESAGDGWPKVTVPTLIFHGVNDDVVDIDLSRTFAQRTPSSRLVELDDGHDLAKSVPLMLASTEAFLREHRAVG